MSGIVIIYHNNGSISKLRKQSKDIKVISKMLKELKEWTRAVYHPNYAYAPSYMFKSYGIGFIVEPYRF
jgi:hypothetical protein